VIHLGHDRSVEEVVNTAIQEDANAIAITPIREDITNILSTCMTCFKKRSGQIKIFWRWRWRNFAFRKAELQAYKPEFMQMTDVPWDCMIMTWYNNQIFLLEIN
jgi:methylmalonyl-CoA mutase